MDKAVFTIFKINTNEGILISIRYEGLKIFIDYAVCMPVD
jgi:hypothetical protein